MKQEFVICQADSGEYYARNEAAIGEIVHNVREGHYCTILGPPYCQKSFLLRDIKARLEATGDEICVLVNLRDIEFAVDEEFLNRFASTIGDHLQAQTDIAPTDPPSDIADERSLQLFLRDYVEAIGQDLVLLLDHLERVRSGPLKALLRVLRAIYQERDWDAPYWLGVVTANSLSTADLALGPVSPFNIARVTLVRDLTPEESERLIAHTLQENGLQMTSSGLQRCTEATGGDRYLILSLCNHCVELATKKPKRQITRRDVDRAIGWFMSTQATQYPPLQDTVRAIEADPIALMNVLKVLEQGQVPRNELELDLETEIDDLQLTGAVRVEEAEDQTFYLIRNQIYRYYLGEHFHPDQVARIFGIFGQWYRAIPYLDRLIADKPEHRSSLLGMVVNSIYASRDVSEACKHLSHSLRRVFAVPRARIYLVNPERTELQLVGQAGFEKQIPERLSLAETAIPEVRAYGSDEYVVSRGDSGEKVLYVPLRRRNGNRLGMVAVHDFEADPQREGFVELLAFLEPAGKAIGSVIDRERKLQQLTILHESGKEITRSLDLQQVLQTTVESAIEAVPAAQKGSLFLWDEKREKLVIQAHVGFKDDIVEAMELGLEEGYAGWVYSRRKPLRLADVYADPRTKRADHPEIREEKSAICVPLEAWGRVIGVLCLDNVMDYAVFEDSDLELLSTFGAQAAIAIQNAHLYTELYALGMQINRGDMTDAEIFRQTVQSITRVSDAKGANMLLLRDTYDPESSVAQKPILSVSEKMGMDFDEKIRPRGDGLTFRVLKAQIPLAVSHPDDPPGINPLPLAQGIQAYLCLPMRIQETTFGVLFVHYDKPHVFSGNEIEMLSLFANQAALAIQNARQREELAMTKAVAWMGIVFSNLAHQITQKAGAIRNAVWGLRSSVEGQPAAIERLDRIDEYAQTIGEIPGQALLPQVEKVEILSLNELVAKEIARWCRVEDGIELDFDGLAAQEIPVRADPKWLAVVLEMLTANANRAMQDSTHKEISVRSEVRGERAVVEFTNTGEEIPEDVHSRLFKEPVPKDRGAKGSGVGLLIARTIMQHYGGDIFLLQTSPEETTFSLWLPLASTGE